jgi:hypothetical protein
MEYQNIATNSSLSQSLISVNFIWILLSFISIIIIGDFVYEKLAKKRKK